MKIGLAIALGCLIAGCSGSTPSSDGSATSDAKTAGQGGRGAGGSGGSSGGRMCFVDFPCYATGLQFRCASDGRHYQRYEEVPCSSVCGDRPCSGGGCRLDETLRSCPAGRACRPSQDINSNEACSENADAIIWDAATDAVGYESDGAQITRDAPAERAPADAAEAGTICGTESIEQEAARMVATWQPPSSVCTQAGQPFSGSGSDGVSAQVSSCGANDCGGAKGCGADIRFTTAPALDTSKGTLSVRAVFTAAFTCTVHFVSGSQSCDCTTSTDVGGQTLYVPLEVTGSGTEFTLKSRSVQFSGALYYPSPTCHGDVIRVDGGVDACNGNGATFIGYTESTCQDRYTSVLLGPLAESWNAHARDWAASCGEQ